MMLDIENLQIAAGDKVLVRSFTMSVGKGQVYALFGPNGSGKSTIVAAIMGAPGYRITKGSIRFEGKDISQLTVDQRVKLGIAVAFQQPAEVKGVTLRDMANICLGRKPGTALDETTIALIRTFQLESFLDRNINVNFSGGEKKRADLLQLLLLKPKFLLLDEPDSGVDIVSLRIIAGEIARYIKEHDASALIITHQGEVLEHIEAERACILWEGQNYCFHSPKKILKDIHDHGYAGCVSCRVR